MTDWPFGSELRFACRRWPVRPVSLRLRQTLSHIGIELLVSQTGLEFAERSSCAEPSKSGCIVIIWAGRRLKCNQRLPNRYFALPRLFRERQVDVVVRDLCAQLLSQNLGQQVVARPRVALGTYAPRAPTDVGGGQHPWESVREGLIA